MYFFHGWFELRCAPHELEWEEEQTYTDTVVFVSQDLLEFVERQGLGSNVSARFEWFNGAGMFLITGSKNRPLGIPQVLGDLLSMIARELPGSYGLLYESNDERLGPPGRNAFRVRRVARGLVTEMKDGLLSPIVPTIEDQ